jgi:hypothetical protein
MMLSGFRFTAYLVLFCILTHCQSLPELKGFDAEAWKKDLKGCQNQRKKMIPILEQNQDKLKGLDVTQIISILGKPDVEELYERNQLYYIYFYAEGTHCFQKSNTLTTAPIVKLRFSATHSLTEVIVNISE